MGWFLTVCVTLVMSIPALAIPSMPSTTGNIKTVPFFGDKILKFSTSALNIIGKMGEIYVTSFVGANFCLPESQEKFCAVLLDGSKLAIVWPQNKLTGADKGEVYFVGALYRHFGEVWTPAFEKCNESGAPCDILAINLNEMGQIGSLTSLEILDVVTGNHFARINTVNLPVPLSLSRNASGSLMWKMVEPFREILCNTNDIEKGVELRRILCDF